MNSYFIPLICRSQACFKTCYQKYVIEGCQCADPQYPRIGAAFGSSDTPADVCQVENVAMCKCRGCSI